MVPGARFAAAMSSLKLAALSLPVLTSSTMANRPVSVIGAKSRCGS